MIMLKAFIADTVITNPIQGGVCVDITNCTFIANIIQHLTLVFFFVVGVILISLIVYAGIIYMSDGGNEENVKKARKIITSAVIGLLIIGFSGVILKFIEAILNISIGI
jgi:hypothetical protein